MQISYKRFSQQCDKDNIFYCMILPPVVGECDNSTLVVAFFEYDKKPIGTIKVANALLQ
jgi:hypothetical protein